LLTVEKPNRKLVTETRGPVICVGTAPVTVTVLEVGPAEPAPREGAATGPAPEPDAPTVVTEADGAAVAAASPRAPRTATESPTAPNKPGKQGASRSKTGDRQTDAMELYRANPTITALDLAVQLRALGWELSDRTAARILREARTNPGRLSAVR